MAPRSCLAVLLLLFCGTVPAQQLGASVKTSSGPVTGKASSQAGVTAYLGIPFGQSTAGANRFMPPKPFTGTAPINATKFGPGCPQQVMAAGGQTAASLQPKAMSEDCLTVNVWTPKSSAEKKAVLLWVYGGAFSMGSSDTALYNGERLAGNQDVIVASFNYRVNVFGFPGAPGLDQLNPGLLDQRLAVEWIRDNIEAFGGDKSRITLFGESAGGSSVDYYAYAWAKDPIVSGLIAQSGSAMGASTNSLHRPVNYDAWYQLSQNLGCGGAGTANTVACVQGKTVKQVQDAIPKSSGLASVSGSFTPRTDDRTVFKNARARAKSGDFMKIPLLVGSNQNESALFGIQDIVQSMALNNNFRCGAADAAKARSINNVPVWRYHFAANQAGSNFGAMHGEEIAAIFGDGKSGYSPVFQPAWAAFAKDPKSGLEKIGWPKYKSDANTLVRIGFNKAIKVDFVKGTLYDQCDSTDI